MLFPRSLLLNESVVFLQRIGNVSDFQVNLGKECFRVLQRSWTVRLCVYMCIEIYYKELGHMIMDPNTVWYSAQSEVSITQIFQVFIPLQPESLQTQEIGVLLGVSLTRRDDSAFLIIKVNRRKLQFQILGIRLEAFTFVLNGPALEFHAEINGCFSFINVFFFLIFFHYNLKWRSKALLALN